MKQLCCILLLLIVPGLSKISAQNSLPEKTVTATYRNTTLKEAIADISQKTGLRFSYSPRRIPENTPVTASLEKASLQTALHTILKNLPIEFEIVDNYVVLKKGRVPAEEPQKAVEPSIHLVTLSGFIKDQTTGEFLLGATVTIPALKIGTMTNAYGFFSITLPLGRYSVEMSYLGYEREIQNIDLQSNCKIDFTLKQQLQRIAEVIISNPESGETKFKRHASQTDVQPSFIAKLPSLMGEPDVLKSLEFQPGISFYGDGSTYFHVRGGNYDQNLILLDEATLFNPSHMLGIFSPVIPDAIRSVDVYKADYPVNYGGRLSSVVDIRTKDGNKSKFAMSGDIGLISARGTVEGPIKKESSSFFISYRKSYFDAYLKPSMPSLEGMYFYDFTTKLNLKLGPKDRLFFTVYSGNDIFRTTQNTSDSNGLTWGNTSTTLRWNHVFGSRIFLNSTILASNYNYYLYTSVGKNDYWNSRITNAALKEEMTWYVSPSLTWRFGVKWSDYGFNPGNYHNSANPNNIQVSPVKSLESVVYAGAEQEVFPWMKLNYGLRMTSWMNSGEAFVVQYDNFYNATGIKTYGKNEVFYRHGGLEPRLSASIRTTKQSSLKMSYSRTFQYINLITNSVSPFNSLEVWLPAGPNIKPQSADITDVGYTTSLGGFDLQTDVYYKWMNNSIGYAYHASMLVNPEVEGQLRQGRSWSYGIEAGLEKKIGKITGKTGYSWSRTFEKIDGLNGNLTYPATFDRPHNLFLSIAWQVRPRWLLAINYNLASGMRYTSPTSFYNYRGVQVPIYTSQNNDELPTYKRTDISSTFQLNKPNRKFQHSLTLSVVNFFNNRNPIFVYYNKQKTADGKFVVPMDRLNAEDITSSMRYIYGVLPSLTYHFNF